MDATDKDAGIRSLAGKIAEETERARRAEAAAERALAELRTVRRRMEILEREASGSHRPRYAGNPAQRPVRSSEMAPPSAPPPLRPAERSGHASHTPAGRSRAPRSDPPVIPEGPEPSPSKKSAAPRPSAYPPPLPPGLAERAGRATHESGIGSWTGSRLAVIVVGAMLVLSVAFLAWWLAAGGISAVPDADVAAEGTPSTQGSVAAAPAPDGEAEGGAEDGGEENGTPSPAAAGVLASLPDDPGARAELFDSLWTARSPLFEPVLGRLEAASDDGDVDDAVEAWRSGAELDALEDDILRSALLQLVLRREIDSNLAVDGQVLRNPCRGDSCSALLNLWEVAGDRFGLPEMPENAPRDSEALGTAERVLLLTALRDGTGA